MRSLLALAILFCPATAAADDPLPATVAAGSRAEADGWYAVSRDLPELPEWRGSPKQVLALAIAKVAANESSMRTPEDVALIHQATTSHGSSVYARLRWLRCHSSRVLNGCERRDRVCDGDNCVWSEHLRWSKARPEGWPYELVPWKPGRWLRVLRLSWALVSGQLEMRVCDEDPYTWGGKMDHARALEHGLEPLGCSALNEGYVLAGGDA